MGRRSKLETLQEFYRLFGPLSGMHGAEEWKLHLTAVPEDALVIAGITSVNIWYISGCL